jgi:arginase family enzyme
MAKVQDRSEHHSLIHVEPSDKESLNISDFFTNKYDYVVKACMYKEHGNTLAVYDLYRQIMIDKNRQIKTPIITLSPDTAISGSTIAGASEKFMYSEANNKTGNPYFRTNLKVIYIDASPDLSTKKYADYSDFSDSVLSDVMGLTDSTYNLHRVDLPPENIYLVGIDETHLDDDQEGHIRKHNIKMFSLQSMEKKGIAKIMKHIINECKYDDVHIVIDLSCMQLRYTPSVRRSNNGDNGFDFDQMKMIVDSFKQLERLNGVDVTGYNFGSGKDKEKHHTANMLTVKTIEMITSSLICLKQNSINVFNEESRFLIWRRIDDEDLLGWLILRGMDLQEREEMITQIGDDRIITVPVPDDDGEMYDAFVTVTTMKEQQEKSYYTAQTVYDCCLYPGEKLNMMFELLNTPKTQQNLEPEKLTNDAKKKSVKFADQQKSKVVPRFAEPVKYATSAKNTMNNVSISQTSSPMIKIEMLLDEDDCAVCGHEDC